jgi:hypothetical protein
MKIKTLLIIALTLLLLTLAAIKKLHACEFLVCMRTDIEGLYGYITAVKEDHATWGTSETPPNFYLVICREMPLAEGQQYLQHKESEKTGVYYLLNTDLMSEDNLNTLFETGKIYLTNEGIQQCLVKHTETIN